MGKSILIICIFIITGCFAPRQAFNSLHSDRFKDKYIDYIASDEVIVNSWYHYVKTKLSSDVYIYRTFFPETKQITSEVRYTSKSFSTTNGLTMYWFENGNQKSIGSILNDKKNGEWKFYHRKSGETSEIGNYRLDKKEDVWKYFDSKGRIYSEITYLNNSKEGEFVAYDSLGVIINSGLYRSDTLYQQTKIVFDNPKLDTLGEEQLPYLSVCKSVINVEERRKCSSQAMIEYVYRNLKYPSRAREYEIEGSAIVQYTIDKNGDVKDIDVIVGLCEDIKNECERIVANMPKMEAGIQNGKKVNVLYTLPIRFKLQ